MTVTLSSEEIYELLAVPNNPRLFNLSPANAQAVINEISILLDNNELPLSSQGITRKHIQRTCMKIAKEHKILPSNFLLRGVRRDPTGAQGEGGFAVIYTGWYAGEKIALKVLRVASDVSEVDKQAKTWLFHRECLLWKGLRHEHVLSFLGIAGDLVDDNQLCMVIPWMENGSLRDYLAQIRAKQLLSAHNLVAQVDTWLHQAAQGLAYLHSEGIVHGDLHTGNLLVDEHYRIHISDFGLSVLADATAYKYGSDVAHGGGARRFTAPELHDADEFHRENRRPSRESDVFSFALTCTEIYSGDVPFPDIPEHQVVRRIVHGARPPRPTLSGILMSDELWALVTQCWEEDPQDRPRVPHVALTLGIICKSHALSRPQASAAVPGRGDPLVHTAPFTRSGNTEPPVYTSRYDSRPIPAFAHTVNPQASSSALVHSRAPPPYSRNVSVNAEVNIRALSNAEAQRALDETWESLRTRQTGIARKKLLLFAEDLAMIHSILPTQMTVIDTNWTWSFRRRTYSRGRLFVQMKFYRQLGASSKLTQERKAAYHRGLLLWGLVDNEHVFALAGVEPLIIDDLPALKLLHPSDPLSSLLLAFGKRLFHLMTWTNKYANPWILQIASGLAYLHEEGIVHGHLVVDSIVVDRATNRAQISNLQYACVATHQARDEDMELVYAEDALHRYVLAPERLDPQHFGRASARPTPASDIYSLAMVACHIYMTSPVWAKGFQFAQFDLQRRIVRGTRPMMPLAMSNRAWDIVQKWWAGDPASRPTAAEAVREWEMITR